MAGEAETDRKKNKNKVIGCLQENLPVQLCLPAQKIAVKLIQKENTRLKKLGEGVPSLKRRGRWSAISATPPRASTTKLLRSVSFVDSKAFQRYPVLIQHCKIEQSVLI